MVTLKQLDEKLDRVENVVIEVKTVLLGTNSDKGLCGQVDDNTKSISHIKLVLAAIGGSGALGGGIVGLIKLLT